MVRTVVSSADFKSLVVARKDDGSETILSEWRDAYASDAFDVHSQALGYFRFAIQEMPDVRVIELMVMRNGEVVELTEITRD